MNRDEVTQTQQQFIAEFFNLNREEKLDFLRFNRYHHLRPINDIISIYIQNPEARFLGTFDEWKDLSTESSVRFGQKANIRLWDKNGRVRETLYDIAQTTLINHIEIKGTILSNRVLVNTLADISGDDYLLGNNDDTEFLASSSLFIQKYLDRTIGDLPGYSERQRAVALSIAQYNIFEEFGAFLDTGVGYEDFSEVIVDSFDQLLPEDNLLRTFSLADSFSRRFTELINERYEAVASLTDDLMLNQSQLNESIAEITADIDFQAKEKAELVDSISGKDTTNVTTIISGKDTTNITTVSSGESATNTNNKENLEQRSLVAEIEWNETSSDETFEFINQSHENAPVNREIIQAIIRDEIKLEQLNELGYYKIQTTLGRIDLGDGFETNRELYQSLSDDNDLQIDVQDYYESIAPEKEQQLSIQDVLQQIRDKLDLSEEFKVKSTGGGDFAIMRESFGGILNEAIVDWYQDGDYEIKSNASTLTSNPLFEQEFNFALTEILEAFTNQNKKENIEPSPKSDIPERVEEVQESLQDRAETVQTEDNKNNSVISTPEAYQEVMKEAYTKLYEGYMHQQDLKRQGYNVSGAYDTLDVKTSDGNIQFGYNYLGRELGTNDDSEVVFWVSTPKEVYATEPMNTVLYTDIIDTFKLGLNDLKFINRGQAEQALSPDSLKEVQEVSLFDEIENSVETPANHEVSRDATIPTTNVSGNDTTISTTNNTTKSSGIIPKYDFIFPQNSNFYPKSIQEKIDANVAAIRLIKELEASQTLATPEQQEVLGKYVGWGGLADSLFDESNPRFEKQRNELKNLVSHVEYAEMRKSSLTAFFTDPKIIQSLHRQLQNLGFSGGKILDPSMGSGNFFAAMPTEMKEKSELYGVEIDQITGGIAEQLHQKSNVQIKGFETTNFADNALDVVTTNVPFSDVIRLTDKRSNNIYPIHDYFIKKSLDLVHEGGFVAVITSTGTMDKKDSRFREEISKVANLVSAVRLPNGTFKSIAGTDVASDILIFQKTATPDPRPEWINTQLQEDEKGNRISVNQFFINSPQYLLGQIKIETFNRGMLSVIRDFPAEDLYNKIDEAFSTQTAQYYTKGEIKEVFEVAVQENSEVPQEIIDKSEPYTIFIYKNKPYYYDGSSVIPHQKNSSVTLNIRETRQNQLTRYQKNRGSIFEVIPKYKQLSETTGYLDSWNNFISTKSGEAETSDIPRNVLDKLASGLQEVVDGDRRYRLKKGEVQNHLLIEEVVSRQYRYKVDYSPKDVKAMRQMIELRHSLQELLNIQHIPDYDQADYETLRLNLNEKYDKFVNEFGPISSQSNSLLMREDDYYEFLASIEEEVENEVTKEPMIAKGAVFFEPTIQPQQKSIKVTNAQDALLASLNHKGKMDFDYMEAVYEKSKEEIIEELGDKLFYIGNGEYQTKEDYLSGDVKTKLLEAENNQEFQVEDRNWFKNIRALEAVIPADLPLSDITFKFGSRFIPIKIYQDFLSEVMDTNVQVEYDKGSDSYDVKFSSTNRFAITNTYGHKSYNGEKLAKVLLNQKPGKIYMIDPNDPKGKKRILDQDATAIIDEKGTALLERFKEWVNQNLEVQGVIVDTYNEQFNRYVVKEYDGSALTVNGLAKQFQPRPHQKNAIMRTVQDLRAGYAHEVGSGKTLTMLASNMKLQELDLVHNPLFVIPKPLINQFAREIYKYFPESKVLVAQSEDFTKAGRKRFVSRIATGKYNAIIIADSQFGKIAMSKNYQENYIKEQLNEARLMMEQAQEGSFTVKQAEKSIEALKTRLEKLQKTDTDSFITFEELGIDMLYVDEAHGYKNLAPYTQLENVKGVSDTRAEKAMDMMMKIEYMHSLYNNRRVVFSTGTPMSNSVVELYTMMKYIEPDVLEKYGVSNFDSFVSSFGIIENSFELTAAGAFKVNRRFTKFGNVPELMNMFRETWDIQTQEMLNLPVPHAETIAHETVTTGEQALYIESLLSRAEAIEAGTVKPWEDNMLKIVGENRKLTLDMRTLDDKLYSSFDSEKLNQVVDEVFRIYTENDSKKSTQMIFSDLSVPVKYRNSQPKNADGSINLFSAYDEIKRMLVQKGVPESEVRFIHEATEKNKESMMRDMRLGKIRVLIGSTSKAGTGLNVQDKMIAVHHLDVPWRPSDITQRNGRLIRQGNENKDVSVHYYITKGSMDAYLWQTQENKSKVINQVMSGRSDLREMEEIGDTQINMGKYKAIAIGDPVKQEFLQLEQKFEALERSRVRFFDSKITDLRRVQSAQGQLPNFEHRAELVQKDIEYAKEKIEQPFEIDIFYKETTRHFDENDKKTEVAEFLARQIQNQSLQSLAYSENNIIKIADYRGFEVLYVPRQQILTTVGDAVDERLILKHEAQYSLTVSPDKPLGIFTKIDNVFENGLNRDLMSVQEEINRLKSSISNILKNKDMAYPKEEEYQTSKNRLEELRGEVNEKPQEQQEQNREKTQELSR